VFSFSSEELLEKFGLEHASRERPRFRRKGVKLFRVFRRTMGNASSVSEPDMATKERVLGFMCSARKIAENLRDRKYMSVVVMAGAGISVSCGIPDFRSPGTGLYDNLQKYNLPRPEAVFELDYFHQTQGKAFYKLAQEMWPDNFSPSPAHLFIRLLNDKGLLKRCFTQNIDTLERLAGIPEDKLVEAHGSYGSASCTKCKKPFDQNECKERILGGDVPIYCNEENCNGLVKPDVVFFGEALPKKFALCSQEDMPEADLLIIMGTSLQVYPFAGLVEQVGEECPRLLLNMKAVGGRVPSDESNGLRLNHPENYRDAMVQGSCDDAVRALCDILGWRDELEELVEQYKSKNAAFRDKIDQDAAFPSMDPHGLDYNWKLSEEKACKLPEVSPIEFCPETYELDELDQEAEASEDGFAMFAFEEHSDICRGGNVATMMCLTGEALESWEMNHVVALVESSATSWSMDVISNCDALQQPMGREGKNCAYHQIALPIPSFGDSVEEYEIWYIDTNAGIVRRRWGPIRPDRTTADAKQHVTSSEIDEIVHAMAELPPSLQNDDKE